VVVGELSRFELWHGRDEPPVEMREVRAGPVTALLEGPDLRYVRLGDVEVLRRLYAAVRDRNWGTIQPELTGVEVDVSDDSFRLAFEARHRAPELGIDFRWRGELRSRADGSLEYTLDGVAESDFLYNRIGFCLLHPAGNAGRPFRARTPDGTLEDHLPDTIGPQRIVDGLPAPIFPSFDELEIEVADGLWARFEFEGDLFETEDQRNWTDASFKTYSTPLALGFPREAKAGQRIVQQVRISVQGALERPRAEAGGPVRVEVGRTVGRLPALGLGMASHGRRLSEREAELLRALRPDHLRVDLRCDGNWEDELERAVEAARQTGAALEVGLFVDEPALGRVAEQLRALDVSIARVLVFRRDEPTTDAATIRLARERLGDIAPIVGGTNVLFTELNRFRPQLEGLDGIAYPLNATVHSDDDTSVVETTAMHGETVRSACAFCGQLPLVVSPVTFNQRFNPVATGPEPEPAPGELPSQVDPRQMSLLGAGWTVGSAGSLAAAGAASVTYFETTGWRGVLETEEGSPAPFASRPGMVFPVYHVLRDLGEWKGADVLEVRSSDPLAVEALAVAEGDGLHLLVANVTPRTQRAVVAPLARNEVRVRRLDEETAALAADEPEQFRGRGETLTAPGGELALELPPFAVARVDA
jgi:hypothetical protein